MEQENPELTLQSKVTDLDSAYDYLQLAGEELNLYDQRYYRRALATMRITVNRRERTMTLMFALFGIILSAINPWAWVITFISMLSWLLLVNNSFQYVREIKMTD